jgi:hypothetical protein
VLLRVVRLHVFAFVVLLVWAQPARADVWDWLEELSGAGPYHSRGNLSGTLYCNKDSVNGQNLGGWFKPLGRDSTKHVCYYADVRLFKANEDNRFKETSIDMYEAGTMFRPIRDIPAFEVGAGAGFMHMNSGGITSDRFTISFPKVALKPLLLIGPLQTRAHSDDYGFIQLYFRETRTVHAFSASDFSTQPGVIYTPPQNGEVLRSFGFIIDATLLGRAIGHGFK